MKQAPAHLPFMAFLMSCLPTSSRFLVRPQLLTRV
jgi:hypothetical protein